MKLGRLKPSYNPKRLHIAKYINRSTIHVADTLPLDMSADLTADRSYILTAMMANGPDPLAPASIAGEGVGDCVWAASVRRMALSALSMGVIIWKNEQDMVNAALDGYASTGFDIQNPGPTDQGTDPTQAFKWLQTVGLLGSDGQRHKIAAAIGVNPQDWEEVQIAFNLCGGLSIGINFPAAWQDSPVWDTTTSAIEGGHEIPAYSDLKLSQTGILIDTWGNSAPGPRIITPAGLAQLCDQLTAVISPEMFGPGGIDVAGFDTEQLQADIQAAA
jgi:hypothetical protein